MAEPPRERYRERLEALERRPLNLDLSRRSEYTREAGWNIDDYEADLPPEPPGEPLPGGSFRAAQEVLREYRFPPPGLITGIFLPERPLEQRVMLLRGRFLGFTFFFGVRVGGVVDELRETRQGLERVWGYDYATLEGHFERGQIEFTVAKRLDSGEVFFRIHAFSRTGTIRNPFYALGFRLFGRRLQRRFAHESMRRVQALVQEKLATGRPGGEAPPVRPASAQPAAEARMEEIAEDRR
ncbi:DUF1990 domain-containing protein [Calidithermus chliarophilus]|uniref:DUF1990 domain-containing protein n=1 Tax=Calidithermus chliarophilus TaxID=52023 RepID=UPI000417A3D2|nr:DUF1990 domain-containing protein [Calidithermus chliarophilus]